MKKRTLNLTPCLLILSVSMSICMEMIQNSATSLAPSEALISSCDEQQTVHPRHDIKCPIICGVAAHLHSMAESLIHLCRFSLLWPT